MQKTIVDDLSILDARGMRDYYTEKAEHIAALYCKAKIQSDKREQAYRWEQYARLVKQAEGIQECLDILLTEASYA